MEIAAVDFAEVMRNAANEGIDLQQIAIKYENLTTDELQQLGLHQVITSYLPGNGVLAKFPESGEPLFQSKASAVLYLGA